ncbi:hypothetical protein LCGC14_1539390 [marine sediment metagenome]|uniref:Uncharacterized protein n=1 Tax=marine sediment metagenome TaxID=412755 RepID=A0A0F9JEG4_9ZZZZ
MFLAVEKDIKQNIKEAREVLAETKSEPKRKILEARIVRLEQGISDGKAEDEKAFVLDSACSPEEISNGRRYFSTGPNTPEDFGE